MNNQAETEKTQGEGAAEDIVVRIRPPISGTIARLAQEERRPRQWQVDLLLRAGLKAIGEEIEGDTE